MKKRADPKINQENLRRWFCNETGILISQAQISKILRDQDIILNNNIKPKQKRNNPLKFPLLDNMLTAWVESIQGKIPLTANLIKSKALFIHSNILGQSGIKFSASQVGSKSLKRGLILRNIDILVRQGV
jgi:hypothetical protein